MTKNNTSFLPIHLPATHNFSLILGTLGRPAFPPPSPSLATLHVPKTDRPDSLGPRIWSDFSFLKVFSYIVSEAPAIRINNVLVSIDQVPIPLLFLGVMLVAG